MVAASVSALFSLRLEELGVPGGESLAALAFLVVAGTVVIYGAAARPLARWLRVAAPERTGVVLVGGKPWLLRVGAALSAADVPVLVLTGDDGERQAAALNGLAPELLVDSVGRANVYVLKGASPGETNARPAFGGHVSADQLTARLTHGETFEVWPADVSSDGRRPTLLFHISPTGILTMVDQKFKTPSAGQVVVLIRPDDEETIAR